MKPYELTYIISSDLKTEEADNLKKDVEVFVQEKGGMIVESLAWPISSQTINQIMSEKKIGIFLPNNIISGSPGLDDVMLQDLPYLFHHIEVVFVAPDLVRIPSGALDIRLDDLRNRPRPRR